VGVIVTVGEGASLGWNDFNAGHCAAVGNTTGSAGQRMSCTLCGRVDGECSRAPLANGPQHPRDAPAEPATF